MKRKLIEWSIKIFCGITAVSSVIIGGTALDMCVNGHMTEEGTFTNVRRNKKKK